MNITVKTSDLSRELGLLEKVVGQKPTIAVLANVLIQAVQGSLILSATDLEIGLVGSCESLVTEAGEVTLPARKLMELVRAQSDNAITLRALTKGSVAFESGKFASKLQSLPGADFPGVPNMDGHQSVTLPRQHLRDLIRQVRYAINEKEKKFQLKGALMIMNEGALGFVATDGARLSMTRIARPDGAACESIIVPDKALDELLALLNEPSTSPDVTFAHSDRHLFFDIDGRMLFSRRIDAKFPGFERMIPKQNEHVMTVDVNDVIPVLKRAMLIDEVVSLTLDADCLLIRAMSTEVGEGAEEVKATYTGPTMTLKYKGQYLLDFLSATPTDAATIAVRDDLTPGLFTSGTFLNVIGGMR